MCTSFDGFAHGEEGVFRIFGFVAAVGDGLRELLAIFEAMGLDE
jgi:hypothetical protein